MLSDVKIVSIPRGIKVQINELPTQQKFCKSNEEIACCN